MYETFFIKKNVNWKEEIRNRGPDEEVQSLLKRRSHQRVYLWLLQPHADNMYTQNTNLE